MKPTRIRPAAPRSMGEGREQGMTTEPQDSISAGVPLLEGNLRAIRAALVVPEDLEALTPG